MRIACGGTEEQEKSRSQEGWKVGLRSLIGGPVGGPLKPSYWTQADLLGNLFKTYKCVLLVFNTWEIVKKCVKEFQMYIGNANAKKVFFFNHFWWAYDKAYWDQTSASIQKILKININNENRIFPFRFDG